MQIKQFAPSRVQIKDATTGEVEAVFATLGVKDHDGDIILPGAIKDGSSVAISAYGHSVWKGDAPAGVGTIHEVDNELILKGRYFLDTDQGRNDFHTVKGLAEAGKGEWSFGLLDIQATKGAYNGVSGNLIKSVDVPEVSPVFIGAGINTRTLVAKGQKQLSSSLRRLLSHAGRSRWETSGTWVWLDDYDVDEEYAVFCVESRDDNRMVRVSFTRTDTAVELGDEEQDVHATTAYLPKSGTKFSEHLTTVLADVKALTARAEEVVALRAAKGKSIGDDASTALAEIGDELERIKSLIGQPTPEASPPSDDTDITGEYLRFVAFSQGVTTS